MEYIYQCIQGMGIYSVPLENQPCWNLWKYCWLHCYCILQSWKKKLHGLTRQLCRNLTPQVGQWCNLPQSKNEYNVEQSVTLEERAITAWGLTWTNNSSLDSGLPQNPLHHCDISYLWGYPWARPGTGRYLLHRLKSAKNYKKSFNGENIYFSWEIMMISNPYVSTLC